MWLMADNLPHTAQPASTKFWGALSLQKPSIIDSSSEFEGGSGGNFTEESSGDSDGILKFSVFFSFFFF